MSRVLSEFTMDDIKTARETANAAAKLAAIPDECDLETQVDNLNTLCSHLTPITGFVQSLEFLKKYFQTFKKYGKNGEKYGIFFHAITST